MDWRDRVQQIETKDPFTGKDVILTWSRIDAAGWSFLTSVPRSEVLAPAKSLRTALLVVGSLRLAKGLLLALEYRNAARE